MKLVIFDCDGVLVDSEFMAAQVESRRYGEHGFELSVSEFAARFAGMTGEAIHDAINEELGHTLPKGLQAEIERELDEALDEVEIIPGAAEVLDRFDQPRCICSNSRSARLQRMLRRTQLWDRFRPYVFSARDLSPPAPKPKPDIFLKGIAEFGVKPREAVVIEDSVHGVHAAVAAGARVIGFTGGRHSYPMHHDLLSEAGAETVISGFADLPGLISAFGEWDGLGM
ncbi:MAG: HAD family phosphatase [Nitratireductor sp.]|nr:HAD family phosphatase [Nitratireductor sp.]